MEKIELAGEHMKDPPFLMFTGRNTKDNTINNKY